MDQKKQIVEPIDPVSSNCGLMKVIVGYCTPDVVCLSIEVGNKKTSVCSIIANLIKVCAAVLKPDPESGDLPIDGLNDRGLVELTKERSRKSAKAVSNVSSRQRYIDEEIRKDEAAILEV